MNGHEHIAKNEPPAKLTQGEAAEVAYARFTFCSFLRRHLYHRRIVGSGFVNYAICNTPCGFG